MAAQAWRGRKDQSVDEIALLFTAGRDVLARPPIDRVLIGFDLWNTEAHNIMLWKKRILSKVDLRQILDALGAVRQEWEQGTFQLDPALEDVHMNIEARVIERIGTSSGGKIHTGRSRNDQVACDMRMLLREELLERSSDVARLSLTLLKTASLHLNCVMPGHTHRRPATITTIAHWLTAHAQALVRDLERMRFAHQLINRCPLGAAAAYGTSWPLDRRLTAELLGFDTVEENTLDCITNRWESEAQTASILAFLMNHCASLAQDLIAFSMQSTRWIQLPDRFTTGSSIMPQKRNPDFAEIILGRAAAAHGSLQTLLGIGRGLPSGYNRETQIGKQTIVELLDEVRSVPIVLERVIAEMKVDPKRLAEAATEGFLNAVDFADFLVRRFKVSFREAYQIVAQAIDHRKNQISRDRMNRLLRASGVRGTLSQKDYRRLCSPESNLAQRKHIGGPAPAAVRANIRNLKKDLNRHDQWLREKQQQLENARGKIEQIRRDLLANK